MKKKLWFAAKVALLSILLFLIWPWVSSIYAKLLTYFANELRVLFGADTVYITKEKYSYFVIPALAIILAATGATPLRKLKYSMLTLVLFLGFDVVSLASGISDIAEGGANFGKGVVDSFATVTYNTFAWVFPLFIVLLFLGGKISRLWQADVVDSPDLKRCPICGQAKTGLEAHIRAVHGEKSLKKARVRRALG